MCLSICLVLISQIYCFKVCSDWRKWPIQLYVMYVYLCTYFYCICTCTGICNLDLITVTCTQITFYPKWIVKAVLRKTVYGRARFLSTRPRMEWSIRTIAINAAIFTELLGSCTRFHQQVRLHVSPSRNWEFISRDVWAWHTCDARVRRRLYFICERILTPMLSQFRHYTVRCQNPNACSDLSVSMWLCQYYWRIYE